MCDKYYRNVILYRDDYSFEGIERDLTIQYLPDYCRISRENQDQTCLCSLDTLVEKCEIPEGIGFPCKHNPDIGCYIF